MKISYGTTDCNIDVTEICYKKLMKNMNKMPFNLGVVFSRCPEFWIMVGKEMDKMNLKKQDWEGNQRAACDIIAKNIFNVKILPGLKYNYPPQKIIEFDFSGKAIVHFKGPTRKDMMIGRFINESWFGFPKI